MCREKVKSGMDLWHCPFKSISRSPGSSVDTMSTKTACIVMAHKEAVRNALTADPGRLVRS